MGRTGLAITRVPRYRDFVGRHHAASTVPEAQMMPHKCTQGRISRCISAPAGSEQGVFLHRGCPKRGHSCAGNGAEHPTARVARRACPRSADAEPRGKT